MFNPETLIQFSGKEVVIPGASAGGLGAAFAHAFKAAGARVTITGVEEEPAPDERGVFDYHRLDVRDLAAVKAFGGRFARVDVLINCPGIAGTNEHDPSDFMNVVDVNLLGIHRLCVAFHPALKAADGCVVNIGSMYGIFGHGPYPAYAASKSGIHGLTKSLAVAWAADGVRVNAVAPGFFKTENSRPAWEDPDYDARVILRTPMKRWGETHEVCGPAMFLASEAAGFVNGTILTVDGGYSSY